MATNAEFYEERAQQSTAEAQGATLQNVRERALRSATVWRSMAERARKVDHDRAVVARAKASAEEAEEAGS